MDLNYTHIKVRKEFGKPCAFGDKPSEILVEIPPDESLIEDFIYRNPVDVSVDCIEVFAEHEANTERVNTETQGVNHVEGGWPKDINHLEMDHKVRFRKKIEKDENYINTVLSLSQSIEHCILQNNAIDIYEDYFLDLVADDYEEPPAARSLNVFRDPSAIKRTATSISWNPEGGQKMAISYCHLNFQGDLQSETTDSYIWDIETPQNPDLTIKSKSYLMSLEYNPKDSHILLGGCYSGQVGFWDDRKGSTAVELVPIEIAHQDPVHNTLWLSSKTGTECFTSSTDGQVIWWDTRKMQVPLERLILDVLRGPELKMDRAHGATAMEYESTMQTKFTVGTEQGTIIVGNRKGKTPQEKMAAVYNAHIGPVYSLQRNPLYLKNFLSVGDWTARIWSEEVKEFPVMWTKYSQNYLTSGAWSIARPSVFFLTTMIGSVEIWDLLFKQKEPTLTIQVCDEPLYSLRVQDQGRLLAVGSLEGSTTLLELADSLYNITKNDRSVLTAMFEREVRREKALEAKYRELRVKKTAPAQEADELAEFSETDIVAETSNSFKTHTTNYRTLSTKEREMLKHTEEKEESEEEEEELPGSH